MSDDHRTEQGARVTPKPPSLPRRLAERVLPKGRFARSVAILLGGTSAAQALLALSAPVLTRLYDPADFGVLGVYGSAVTILGVLVGLRYLQAVPLPAEELDAANVAGLSVSLGAVMSLVVGVLGVVLSHPFAEIMGVPQLAPYMWLLPLSLFGNCLYQTLYIWAIREQGFAVMARTRITQSVARVATQLVLGVAGIAPLGLLLGDLAGGAVGSGSFARLVNRRRPETWRSITLNGMRRVGRRYARFAWYGTPAGLLNVAGLQGIPLLVAYSYGATVAGWYALTMRVLALPVSVLGQAVGETYFSIAPRLMRTDPPALRRLFRDSALRLLLIGIGPTLVLMIWGPFLFSLIFGSEWRMAGVYARYLAPALLAQLVMSPLSDTTIILERLDLQLATDAVRVGLILAAFFVVDQLAWSPNAAILALSAALLLSYAVYFCVAWILVRGLKPIEGMEAEGVEPTADEAAQPKPSGSDSRD